MWWYKYLIFQCSALGILQLIISVNSQDFISPDELFASLKNDDEPIRSEELSSDHLIALTSTTIAPENLSQISTSAPILSDSNEGSNFYKKSQIFEEKSTARVKTNTEDGTETEFQSGPIVEKKFHRISDSKVLKIPNLNVENDENRNMNPDINGVAILEDINIPDILKLTGINIADINKSPFPNSNTNFNAPTHPSWTQTYSSRNNFDSNPLMPNFDPNFNSPPRPSWTQTSSSRNNFDSNTLSPNFDPNFNFSPRQTWTGTSSSSNNFYSQPSMPNFGTNFNSPPLQTWTQTSSSRNNFDSNPLMTNFHNNFNSPPGQTWTRTYSSRNNFDGNPFLENTAMNFNAPTHQSWIPFPADFNTNGNFYDNTREDAAVRDTYGPSRSHSSGYHTVRTTVNGQTMEKTVRW